MRKIFFILLVSSINTFAQETLFKSISFNDDIKSVKKELLKISGSLMIFVDSNTTFPLAKHTANHIVVRSISINDTHLQKAVFTFSDNKLSYVECFGNVMGLLKKKSGIKTNKYLHYEVYMKDLIFLDKKADRLWMLTPEGAHAHLFTWLNPYLNNSKKAPKYDTSVKLPNYISLGKDFNTIKKAFVKNSKIVEVDSLIKKSTEAQIQINSFGVVYAGFPRKFEARFKDDKLNRLWILTTKNEEARIQRLLTQTFGDPIFINKNWCFYKNWTVALRKDIPEVLFASKEIAKRYKEKFSTKNN